MIVPRQRVSSGRFEGQPPDGCQVVTPGQPGPARNIRYDAQAAFSGLLMTSFETIEIDEMVAACNGGGGPLGHPRVYLNLGPAGRVECPYCSRRFVNRAIAGTDKQQPGETPTSGAVGSP